MHDLIYDKQKYVILGPFLLEFHVQREVKLSLNLLRIMLIKSRYMSAKDKSVNRRQKGHNKDPP